MTLAVLLKWHAWDLLNMNREKSPQLEDSEVEARPFALLSELNGPPTDSS